MAAHSRGARRAFASLNVRDSDNDFTLLLDRSSIAPSSVPPPPRSEARPRLGLSRRAEPRREEPPRPAEPTIPPAYDEPAFPQEYAQAYDEPAAPPAYD